MSVSGTSVVGSLLLSTAAAAAAAARVAESSDASCVPKRLKVMSRGKSTANVSTAHSSVAAAGGAADKIVNPFRMPSDEEVFAIRDDERRRREEERKHQLSLPAQEKGTWGSKAFAATAEFVKSIDSRALVKAPVRSRDAAASQTTLPPVRRDRENTSEFIAKKREMFLVQMSLDTKRAEIRKLEEQAQQREDALKRSESMLEEDAMRFDAFLKENDYKAVEAIRKAEQETKAKQERIAEIKRISSQIASVKSDMGRFEEQLEDCRRFRDFLYKLSPEDWRQEQEQRVAAIRAKRKAAQAAAAASGVPSSAGSGSRATTAAEGKTHATVEAAAAVVDEEAFDWDEDPALYFTSPQQLLDIFSALEERNLFLIQNSQETEEALEELRQKLEDTKSKMTSETGSLAAQIQTLQASIDQELKKARMLSGRTQTSTDATSDGNDVIKTLDELNVKIADLYSKCGFDQDASLATLQMLANIESRLEEYISLVESLPPALVEEAEKTKEKERRQRVRDAKLEEERALQAERIERSVERAQASTTKKIGKPVMFRAPPVRKQKVAEAVQVDTYNEEDDIREFFVE